MARAKICGITNLRDALVVSSSGADYMGFIVDVPVETPRRITLQQAWDILQFVDRRKAIVVVMPSSLREVENTLELHPFGLQFHGDETPEFLEEVRGVTSGTRIIKTLHVKGDSTSAGLREEALAYGPHVDYLLLDTQTEKSGGTGLTHDWSISAELAESAGRPVFLSGGINPGNVRKAVEEVRPYCIDASSGLECQPGFKDHGMVMRFMSEVRACSI